MRTLRSVAIVTLALALAALAAAPALAGRGLVVGVNEDAVKWRPDISSVGSDLNLGYYRVTQGWEPGRTQPSDSDAASIAAALANAGSQKILLSVFGSADAAPRNASSRADYCGFVSSVLDRFPQIAAVNIWNEANLAYFWKPQFTSRGSSAAPAAYEELMARCYDAIKSRHPSVRVITSISPRGNDRPHAPSNVSHSARNFIEKMGQAYRRSHRRARIFDVWGQNVYGSNSKERPWTRHRRDIGEGDYARLLSYLRPAFGGTHQPVPGQKDVRIWYLEDGFQTSVAAKRILYFSTETDHAVVASLGTTSQLDQASQLTDAVRLAYCQPAVGGFFNFLLADESNLHGWQSGVFFSDWTPKPSYQAFKSVIAEANAGRVNCVKLRARIKRLGG
ncbi:MAG: hypothetical protein ACTHNY_08925 [Solirubrobacterales bacterium]